MRDLKKSEGVRFSKESIKELRAYLREKHPVKEVGKEAEISEIVDSLDDMSLDSIDQFCESEIEKQVGYALFLTAHMEGEFVKAVSPSTYYRLFMGEPEDLEDFDLKMGEFFSKTDLLIVPNMPWEIDGKRYRSDFMLSHKQKGKKKRQFTLLECDSFLYHSSADQLEKEKKRERVFAQFPQKLLRFSGREIHRNPTQVAYEILETCLGKTYG